MIESDKKQFALETKALFESLNQPIPNKQLLIDWWQELSKYDLKVVLSAYNELSDELAMPTIENLKKWLIVPNKPKPKVKPVPVEYEKKGDGLDYARLILATPKDRPMVAIKHAKFVLKIKD